MTREQLMESLDDVIMASDSEFLKNAGLSV